MRKSISLVLALAGLLACSIAYGQGPGTTKNYDVFIPIAKYIAHGDAESLSAWFDNDLEITVFSSSNDASRNQAKQIMKTFFDNYSPREFRIAHTASSSNMKYAIGSLNAGGETFGVTIYLNYRDDGYHIQQIKIEQSE